MLIRTNRGHAEIGREESCAAISRLSEVNVRLETRASCIVSRVIEGDVDGACYGINREPVVEAVHWGLKLVSNSFGRRPSGTVVIRGGNENIGDASRREVHPRTV